MRILIAGLGSIGKRHLRNLVELGEAGEVLLLRSSQGPKGAGRPARLDPKHDYLDDFACVTRIQDAIDWRPHAAIVSNPTALHLDIAIPAAEAGCHLLLEKPVSHSMQRIDLLREAVKRAGGRVMVGYQFRFHPGLQKIAQLLQEGAIGLPLSVRAQWSEWLPGWHPWEDYRQGYSARYDLGGGVILTLSHPLDYLVWLLGEVEALWAFTSKNKELSTNVEDNAEIGLQFKNGTVGSVHLDYNGQPSSHELEIIGTHGTISWDHATGAVALHQQGKNVQTDDSIGSDKGWEYFPAPDGYNRNDMFLAEIQHFLSIIRRGDAPERAYPACTLENGIYVLKICLAALLSSQTGILQRIQ
jgi:predicted dehydrogenase